MAVGRFCLAFVVFLMGDFRGCEGVEKLHFGDDGGFELADVLFCGGELDVGVGEDYGTILCAVVGALTV